MQTETQEVRVMMTLHGADSGKSIIEGPDAWRSAAAQRQPQGQIPVAGPRIFGPANWSRLAVGLLRQSGSLAGLLRPPVGDEQARGESGY